MTAFGLLGQSLGHSYSPQIHKMLECQDYALINKERNELGSFLKAKNFQGLNVTIPYKKKVIPFLDSLSEEAKNLQSVNTIVKKDNNMLIGDNTDFYGFDKTIEYSGIDVKNKKALVLGNGGVASTVKAVLTKRGIKEIVTISRQGKFNYSNIGQHDDAQIIVNATPVGMFPNNGESLVKLQDFPHLEGVFDLIYNPARTKLLLDAERLNIPYINGLFMLVAQAKKSEELFFDKQISDDTIEEIYHILLCDMQNVALIGMPGVGKTSCGKELSRLTKRTFIDIDEEVSKALGMSIEEFFAQNSEKAFREIETKILEKYSKKSGLIIATGGGIVTNPLNYDLLHQNSFIFLIERDLDTLDTRHRPLSLAKGISELARERMPIYQAWADYTIQCNDLNYATQKIVEVLHGNSKEDTCH